MKGMSPPRFGLDAAHAVRTRAVLIACALAGLGAATANADIEADASSVLIKIARFASWPDNQDFGLSFRVCLRDDDPAFARFLDLEGTMIKGKPISVHGVPPQEFSIQPCHAIYFSTGLATDMVLSQLDQLPILTISPEEGFAERGGLVEFAQRGGRTVLIVDRHTALTHPLQLSAPLMQIAEEMAP